MHTAEAMMNHETDLTLINAFVFSSVIFLRLPNVQFFIESIPLAPNGGKPVKEPNRENGSSNINP